MEKKLNLTAVLRRAMPETWPASIVLAALGCVLAMTLDGRFRPLAALATVCIAVLLQSAFNILNHYMGRLHHAEPAVPTGPPPAPDDAYTRKMLTVALFLLLASAGLGVYIMFQAGWQVLFFAAAAALCVMAYLLPTRGAASLPVGELLSGVVIGGGLPCGAYFVQTGHVTLMALLACLPAVVTVALLMLTNNCADAEKDRAAGRRTLPMLMGKRAGGALCCSLVILAGMVSAAAQLAFFSGGWLMLPFMVVGLFLNGRHFFLRGVDEETREESLAAALGCHCWVNGCLTISALLSVLLPRLGVLPL